MNKILHKLLKSWQKYATENVAKPPLRSIKYQWLYWSAKQRILHRQRQKNNQTNLVAFLIGCGRSGTTLLGQILSQHPQLCYFFEPYHLWAAIDRKTDALNLYHIGSAAMFMDVSDIHEYTSSRFYQLFQTQHPNQYILEKTPLNALRIGYLNAIVPNAKFIHLVRDGVDVCRSIERLANTNSYKITGKPQLNQWWGINHSKWKALARDGANAGYYTDEINFLQTNVSKGAYEWLVTLGEIDRWKQSLGNRFWEVSYEELTASPESVLSQLCDFLEITAPSHWFQNSISTIQVYRRNHNTPLALPTKMCQAFNQYQQQYGFAKRAICYDNDQ